MAAIEHKNLDQPDETRKFAAHGYLEVVTLHDATMARAHFQPGWRWSQDVKPIAGTDLCMASHTGCVLEGTLIVQAADGTQARLSAGEAYCIEPGHDAWVEGIDPVIALEFTTQQNTYAKPR